MRTMIMKVMLSSQLHRDTMIEGKVLEDKVLDIVP